MILYDKLKNISTGEKTFDFICTVCKCDGMKKGNFEITPLNIAWRPDTVDNSDIKNVALRKGYDALPTIRKAILKSIEGTEDCSNVNIMCNVCNTLLNVYDKTNISDFRKWLNRNHKEFLDLRIKK